MLAILLVCVIVLVIGLTPGVVLAATKKKYKPNWRFMALAVGNYESGYGKWLEGDEGRAVGFMHIRHEMVNEVNRILAQAPTCKLRYTYMDRLDREKSIEMFCIYMQYWCERNPQVKNARKLEQFHKTAIPMWNCGPLVNVYRNKKAQEYWRRVKLVMQNMEHDD